MGSNQTLFDYFGYNDRIGFKFH